MPPNHRTTKTTTKTAIIVILIIITTIIVILIIILMPIMLVSAAITTTILFMTKAMATFASHPREYGYHCHPCDRGTKFKCRLPTSISVVAPHIHDLSPIKPSIPQWHKSENLMFSQESSRYLMEIVDHDISFSSNSPEFPTIPIQSCNGHPWKPTDSQRFQTQSSQNSNGPVVTKFKP